MDHKKYTAVFSMGIVAFLVILVLLLAHGKVHRTGSIVLPETGGEDTLSGEDSTDRLNIVEITPDTIQPAITTLVRPYAYHRTQKIETMWSGGSGEEIYTVSVSGNATRLDRIEPDGGSMHILIVGDRGAIWYDEDTTWSEISVSRMSTDELQRMPTYETVRDLPAERVAHADYRTLESGEPVIYVVTVPDENGYADSYWVSTATGLLSKAERTRNDTIVYRFTAGQLREDAPDEDIFTLPNGGRLGAELYREPIQ